MLHITNGDITAALINDTGIGGDVLPWRDVLHEGPVPAGLDLEAMSRVRARFLADSGWSSAREVMVEFEQRDARLRQVGTAEDVVLWFEADLYDQLQLIQLLDWFSQHPARSLRLICIAEHHAISRFIGLGQLTPSQIADLFPIRRAVTGAQLELGRDAWTAFRLPDPIALTEFLKRDTTPLPFLAAALFRLLEEYPSIEEGAGRTERQVLDAVSEGAATFQAVFDASQGMESRPFMGDLTLWTRIVDLTHDPGPALHIDRIADIAQLDPTSMSIPLELTTFGRAYLGKTADLVRNHGIDRWIGGVHLSGTSVPWRWDREKQALISG